MSVSTRDKRYLIAALRESLRGDPRRRVRIGACLVIGNYVVARAANCTKTHTVQHRYNTESERVCPSPALHAEMYAILKARSTDLSGATMFVGRLDRNGAMALCRPCNSCISAMKDAGIRKIVYTSRAGIAMEYL